MPIFNVDIDLSLTVVVEAEDASHAWDIAQEGTKGALREQEPRIDIHVTGEAKTLAQLKGGWDGMCIAYGGDGNTRLKDLLPEG